MGLSELAQAFTAFLAMILALSCHEAAHAWVAKMLGDRTAEFAGRLTLNPLAHADPIGTLLLPAMGSLLGMPLIGWAKPVPIDPRNLADHRIAPALVAAAGPGANLLLCALTVLYITAFGLFGGRNLVAEGSFLDPLVWDLPITFSFINAILAFFNLIPLPPLDGASVLGLFLPGRWMDSYDRYVAPYGIWILWALMLSGGLRWLPGLAKGYWAWVEGWAGVVLGVFVGLR